MARPGLDSEAIMAVKKALIELDEPCRAEYRKERFNSVDGFMDIEKKVMAEIESNFHKSLKFYGE